MNNQAPQNSDQPNAEHSTKNGLIAWFAGNHVAANILMFLFIIGGIIAVASMRTETFPSIDPGLITVSVPYPGSTPYEIADSITSRVEEGVLGIEGVKRISSTASEGFGIVSIELEDFANPDDVYSDVETAVNRLSDFPPEDAERPTITKVKVTPNVLSLAIHGEANEDTLKFWAEAIEDDLRLVDGVAKTTLRGIRDHQISIEISENTLRQYGLSLEDISTRIRALSVDLPAGTIESQSGDVLLRVQDKKYSGQEFAETPIITLENGSSLRLRDIGRVIDGFEDTNLISKFNGERAAFIDVYRSDTGDTLSVAKNVKSYLSTMQLPNGLSLSIQQDETLILTDRINLMLRNAIIGFMLVFLILLLFLDFKLAFWTSAAIPVSFLGGMMIIYGLGYSLNMISLFALIVVLGIVVDDAIVTGESIFDAQEREPNNPNAVLQGVKTVIAPVTVGVLTTMAAFAPLIFSTGTLGQIISIIPIVVIPILFVSLIEAYFILPAHLSHAGRWSKGIMVKIRNLTSKTLMWVKDNIVEPLARFAIHWRYATLAAFIGFAVITAGMLTSGTVRFIFFPQVESDEITITATMPQGTPFSTTEKIMLDIEENTINVQRTLSQNANDPYKSLSLSIGETAAGRGPGSTGNGESASNIGQLKIQLISSDFRSASASEIEDLIRKRIINIPNIETLEFQSSLVGDNADFEIDLSHPNEAELNAAADELKAIANSIEGTKEVQDSFEDGKTEYVFEITDKGLAAGLTSSDIGRQLRSAFFGSEVQRFQRGRSEVIVYVRYPKDERESLDTLRAMRIRLADGTELPLSQVATIKAQTGYSQIQTVNGRRVVTVKGDVDYAIATPSDVIKVLTQTHLPELAERYPGLSFRLEGESREQQEDLASLGRNMLIAMMIIYVLLGSQLRSYVQPLLIMSAIPFGVIGAIWGHFLLGHDLTFISLFGIVALSGVVINDSVVLIDYFNKRKGQDKNLVETIVISVRRRFRPILLTTLTTSLGLLPILLEKSLQAQFLIPMVISLATGILFVTVIILVLLPVLLMILEDIKYMGKKMTGRI